MLWTPADHTYTGVGCEGMNGPSLYVEALAEDIETDGSCAPDVVPALEPWRLIIMNIAPWDGQAGTYVVGDGAVTAGYGGRRPASGELRVEISEPWVPQTLSFTLDGVEGTLDLTACLYGTDVPCAP